MPLEDVPFDMLLLMALHSSWKTRTLDQNAEQILSSQSRFIQMLSQLKYFYDRSDFQPDWYPLSMPCILLSPS